MHSAIFEAGGAPPESVYAPSRQNAMLGEVNRALATPRQERDVVLPRPADMKATANAGHGVVIWGGSARVPAHDAETANAGGFQSADAPKEFVQFGEAAEPMQVVHANRDDRNILREFRNTSTGLHWTDQRSERVCCRGQEYFKARAGMDAGARKRHEFSSEVFGRTTASEAPQTRNSRVEQPCNLLERTQAKLPLSARERVSHNLNPSNESQFSVYAENVAMSPPSKQRDVEAGKDSAAALEARRRTERNFSDLFGKPTSERSASAGPRTELHGTSNVDFLDFHVEIASRRRDRRSPPPQKERVIYRPSGSSPERACWDTRNIMNASSEIARRRRDRGPEGDGQARERSASERKRVELCSGQFRIGTGATPEPHDDGRPGPVSRPPPRTPRSFTDSPLGRSYRSVRPDSAKGRKMSSLMSSGIF